jgi:hypothetical protein
MQSTEVLKMSQLRDLSPRVVRAINLGSALLYRGNVDGQPHRGFIVKLGRDEYFALSETGKVIANLADRSVSELAYVEPDRDGTDDNSFMISMKRAMRA